MLMTFKEFNAKLEENNKHVFPYDETWTFPHILEDGTLEDVMPVWFQYLFNYDENALPITFYALKKYKSMLIDTEDFENTHYLNYKTYYKNFIYGINETMYRYWDLFTQHNNPYHNVDEDTTITNTYGETVTTSDIDERKTTQNFDATKSTENIGKYGQDSATLKNTDKSVIDTDARQDVTSSDSAQDKITVSTHTDTLHTVRGGNIGVTTNKTLAFEHLDYASMMKLYDMFLKEYFDFFGVGVWRC